MKILSAVVVYQAPGNGLFLQFPEWFGMDHYKVRKRLGQVALDHGVFERMLEGIKADVFWFGHTEIWHGKKELPGGVRRVEMWR